MCMNSMNYTAGHNNLRLCSRNEGKLKSYESCRDVRAWSHDVRARDRYLREWIRSDMPTCVFSTGTLARFMRTMTYRNRGRIGSVERLDYGIYANPEGFPKNKATPRCHPDCKSKVVLDSICNSCDVMKECFKNDENFENYFDDEEFETSHWPCERCLEALKSIKMFWKIIIDKIFSITIPKTDLNQNQCCRTDNVRSVAKIWQSEMTQQAMFVKNISYLNTPPECLNLCDWTRKTPSKEIIACGSCECEHRNSKVIHKRSGKVDCNRNAPIKSYKVKSTDTNCLSNPLVHRTSRRCSSLNSRKHSKVCSASVKLVDVGCHCDELIQEMNTLKTNLEQLEEKCDCQKHEIDKLSKENSSLRIELQNVYKSFLWKSKFLNSSRCTSYYDTIANLPKPFECCADDDVDQQKQVKGVESEMIITMKNGKNEAYGHISLLQVLHKTNCPDIRELNLGTACSNKNEDPVALLTKVQNTFGAIVRREMGIANKRDCESNKCAIDASFSQVNASKSTFSSSTNMHTSTDSYSTNDATKDRRSVRSRGDNEK